MHAPFEMLESEVLTEVALQFKVTQGGVNPVIWDTHSHNWSFVEDGEAWSWPIFAPGGRRPGKGMAPITDARKGAITDGLTKASSMIGVGHEVFKGLVRTGDARPLAQPPKAVQPAKRTEPAPGPAQPLPSTPQMAPGLISVQQPVESESGFRNGKTNGAAVRMIPAESGTQFRNGNGKVNGAGHPGASADFGHSVRNGDGNGAATTVIQVSATTYWTLANKYTDRLDRAVVSALAKDVVTGKMSWLEAQTILHDMIEDNGMPAFGSISSPRETIHEKAMGQVVQYAEKVRDPLDELFA